MMTKHYNKISFQSVAQHVRYRQRIKVVKRECGLEGEVLYEGTYKELQEYENRKVRYQLEYQEVTGVFAEGDVLTIGIRE
jgi:hypothetical protein